MGTFIGIRQEFQNLFTNNPNLKQSRKGIAFMHSVLAKFWQNMMQYDEYVFTIFAEIKLI